MSTTTVPNGSTVNNQEVTGGNTLEVQSGGTANATQVDNLGTLQVDAGGVENGATILAGGTELVSGTVNPASGGTNFDVVYGTLTATSTGVVNNVMIQSGGTVNLGTSSVKATGASLNGATVFSGGSLIINGNNAANNVTLQGGTLELQTAKSDTVNATGASATGTLTFASGYNSTLKIDVAQNGTNGTTFAQKIAGFAPGSTIDLKYLTSTGSSVTQTQSNADTIVTVTGGGSSGSETFTFLNTTAGSFVLGPDAGSGIYLTESACFAAGTRIRTTDGDIAIEELAVGDIVVTASGEERPIRWLGHRTIDCRLHANPDSVWPVRIAAHALGPNRPERDLYVSPGHAICVDVIGEILISASALENGSTIQQVPVDSVTYWHVELDSHDIILAENVPTESYLDMGNRSFFQEETLVDLAAGPDDVDPSYRTHQDFCRPFLREGLAVDAVRDRLAVRARALGWTINEAPETDLYLLVDGRRIDPSMQGLTARFIVPAYASDVWLISSSARARHVYSTHDTRPLGVFLSGLTLSDGFETRSIPLDDPRLSVGFHDVEEGALRWTDGRACLPTSLWDDYPGETFLRVDLAGPPLPRWLAPVQSETLVALAM